jgi:hypothetical protein
MDHPQLGDQKVAVRITPGTVVSVVALPQVEETKKEDEEPKVVLTHQLVEQELSDSKESHLTVVQITPAEQLSLSIAGKASVAAPKGKPETVTITGAMGDFPEITLGDLKVCTMNFVDPGDQVLVLFTNREGLLQHVTFNNMVR